MIPRINRLPTTRLSSSQAIAAPLFILRFTKNTLSYPRFAFVISKKIDKRAVVRNRLKRVLREIAYQKMLEKPAGIDLLFIVKKNFADVPSQEIEEVITQALQQISV